jgi:hypothetical protein
MEIPLYKSRKNFTGDLKAFNKIHSEKESVSFKKLFSLNSREMKKERNLINYRKSRKSVNVEDDLKSVNSRTAMKETLISGGRQKINNNNNNNIIQNLNKLNKNKSSGFTYKESKLNLRMKYIDSIIFAIIVLNISLSLWENNIFTQSSLTNGEIVNFKVNDTVNTLRWICLALSLSIVIILIIRYTISLSLLRLKNLAGANDGIITTGLWKYLLLEIIINMIFSPPYLEGSFSGRMLKGTYTYSFDTIINFLVFFKLYYTLRFIYVISPFLSENAKTVAKKHKMNLSLTFALKCHLRRRPFLTLSILFPISICIFGLIVRTFEFGFVDDHSEQAGKTKTNPSFENYFNSFWLIITTMLTIGYGDIYPKSHLGRVVLFISVVVGMILVSLMIVFLSYLIECSPEENKVHTLVEIDKVRDKLLV